MKCEHCKSENLSKKFLKSSKLQSDKVKRYFRYCKNCGYNTYNDFPSYLDESQYERYVEQNTRKEIG